MHKLFFVRYKIPILISLVIALAVVVISRETYWLTAILTFAGAFIGMFLVELEYVLHAYIVDPSSDLSNMVKEKVKNKDLKGYIEFIHSQEYNYPDATLHSAFFQILIAIFTLYTVIVSTSGFAIGLTLSLSANLMYSQLVEYQHTKSLKRWFWIYKGELNNTFYSAYFIVIVLLFFANFYFV